ncbi:MAG TPA: HlyD family secretion protein [Candidatus Omnitrophota bacterium]|nr:HlyD family secretion protein [Candidatus Omnitrophota bacterium]HPS37710.1 HlyD family secretion protein [Candidatus Omnitrophota bacterium]
MVIKTLKKIKQMDRAEFKRRLYADDPTFRFVVACVGGFLLIGLLWIFYQSLCYVSTDDAFVEGHVAPISPKVSAQVIRVPVKDNQEVKTGDLLVELDVSDYRVQHDMAKADLMAAEAEAQKAHADEVRYKKLNDQDEVSKQQLDMAVLRTEVADAKVAAAKARLEQTGLEVSYTKITAPISGHVTRKSVELGALVQTGQPLMAIVSDEKWVVANFKETQLRDMHSGQKVKIKVDTYPGKTFHGHVDSIQRGTGARFSLLPPENATGNFVKVVQRIPVKIVFDEKPEKKYPLGLGMSVVPEVKVH